MSDGRLAGRTAVVVGGGVGLGRAAARRLAADGAEVVVVDADADACGETCAGIAEAGGSATWFVAHPADHDELRGVAGQHEAAGRPVDVLVNHHMALDWTSIEECDIATFSEVVRHNLVGPVAATKAFLPLLKRSAHASVIHLGSIDGLQGNPWLPSYSASKGGLVPLTHVMAAELAAYDIRVNAIASGQTNQVVGGSGSWTPVPDTPAWAGYPGPEWNQRLAECIPLKRHGAPEEWAGPISFLASDDASYVTGTVLVVDCGRTGITPGTGLPGRPGPRPPDEERP